MPERTRFSNAQKSKMRSALEHVFAHQKGLLGLIVRTIGLARARLKLGLANALLRLVADKECARMRTKAARKAAPG